MNRKKKSYDLNFEINFFEGILKRSPNFIEVLSALGNLYTRRGLCEKGLEMDERLYQLRPTEPLILYNLACSYSLLNQTDKALRSIKFAIRLGYNDFDFLETDKDLSNLRRDRRFTRFFERIKNKKHVTHASTHSL